MLILLAHEVQHEDYQEDYCNWATNHDSKRWIHEGVRSVVARILSWLAQSNELSSILSLVDNKFRFRSHRDKFSFDEIRSVRDVRQIKGCNRQYDLISDLSVCRHLYIQKGHVCHGLQVVDQTPYRTQATSQEDWKEWISGKEKQNSIFHCFFWRAELLKRSFMKSLRGNFFWLGRSNFDWPYLIRSLLFCESTWIDNRDTNDVSLVEIRRHMKRLRESELDLTLLFTEGNSLPRKRKLFLSFCV